MKVLFAIGNDQTSKKVAERYYEKFSEELVYKNVYYFKSLLETVKEDKTFDRIVINENLEPFVLRNLDSVDRFIFSKVDAITDEIEDSEIIFICSDRRTKENDKFVEKLFNIGVYNTLIGDDENTVEYLCNIIKKPMNKKEAKRHLNITSVVSGNTVSDSDDTVEEIQIMNILKYYENIKGQTEKYVESFDKISEQYSRNQLKVIVHYLPGDVKNAIISSDKYAYLVETEEKNPEMTTKKVVNKPAKKGLFGILKENKEGNKKKLVSNNSNKDNLDKNIEIINETTEVPEVPTTNDTKASLWASVENELKNNNDIAIDNSIAEQKSIEEEAAKQKALEEQAKVEEAAKQKALEEQAKAEESAKQKAIEEQAKAEQAAKQKALEEQAKAEQAAKQKALEEQAKAEHEAKEKELEAEKLRVEQERLAIEEEKRKLQEQTAMLATNAVESDNRRIDYKKLVLIVGANKSGSTFMVNAVAHNIADKHVTVGILDMTKDRSMYYIYNQDDKGLRKIASECINNLYANVDTFIPVEKFLKVYTDVPNGIADNRKGYKHRAIIDTVKNNNNLVIIDADFTTPLEYFEKADEIYLVQDLDILKMQETTLFLRELKGRSIDMSKIKVIINKYVKTSLTPKRLIEGLSYYSDPQMSFIEEIFVGKVQNFIIPFDVNNYAAYAEGLCNNDINYKKYTPEFMNAINELSENIFRTGNSNIAPKKKGIFG